MVDDQCKRMMSALPPCRRIVSQSALLNLVKQETVAELMERLLGAIAAAPADQSGFGDAQRTLEKQLGLSMCASITFSSNNLIKGARRSSNTRTRYAP